MGNEKAVGKKIKTVVTFPVYRDLCMEGYGCFGYTLCDELPPAPEHSYITLRFQSDPGYNETARQVRLRRKFDSCIRELTALEKARTSSARAAALLMGLSGTALLAGGFYAVFAAHATVMIVLVLAGMALCILPALIYPAIVRKQEKMLAPYIAKLQAEATQVYLKAKDSGNG